MIRRTFFSLSALALVFLATPLFSADAFDPVHTYALLVGLVQWQDHGVSWYPTEGRQDRALERALVERGVPPSQITFLEDAEASRGAILSELEKLASRAPQGSTLFLYFTGHGAFSSSDPYFFPNDGFADDFARRGIAPREITEIVSRAFRGRRVLVFGDFCYSEIFNAIAKRLGEEKGLETLALTSAELRSESTPEWTFTEALVDLVRGTPFADRDGDGVLTFAEWARYSGDAVYFRADQVPGPEIHEHLPESLVMGKVRAGAPLKHWGAIREGDYVEYPWKDHAWYPSQLLHIESDTCVIDTLDHKQRSFACGELRAVLDLPRAVGQKLEAVYNGKHNPVTVLAVYRNFLYVRFTAVKEPYDEWIDAADTVVVAP